MLQHITSGSTPFVYRGEHELVPSLPQPRQVCADCQSVAETGYPLYPMNGQSYCAECLQAWCASLPAVQADLLAWTTCEQEG
jgi:hypothetical protein